MQLDRSHRWNERLHHAIPGGAHTYAKGDDQWPEGLNPVIERGAGCHVWDVDGNRYLEYGAGLRAVTLGHAHPVVDDAVRRAIGQGVGFVRPSRAEAEAAEKLLELVPTMDMVKFAKNGSDVTTAATKLARAVTGRDLIAVCAHHPFFSVDDWFIGTTEIDAGIPEAVTKLTVGFPYNDLAALEALFAAHPGQIAAVVMEVERIDPPDPGYLAGVRQICDTHGALLVFDEIVTGFRWASGGAHSVHGVTPDLACFGKGIANGYALAALTGSRQIMERGGLRHEEERVFLLSTTYGAEPVGLAAGVATMDVYATEDVTGTLRRSGMALTEGLRAIGEQHGIAEYLGPIGHPACLFFFTRDPEGRPSQPYRTLFLQECVRRGLLAPSLVVSAAHDDAAVDQTLTIIDEAAAVYAKALSDGVDSHLDGRPVASVYRKRNRPTAR